MSRRRVKIKPKFYLILTFVVGMVALMLVLMLQDTALGTLKYATMDVTITKKAVLVRDEMSISVDKYDRAEFAVGEGESVYEGMQVATVYKWGYTDDMAQSLLNIEAEIYALQKSRLSGVDNAELSSMELQIEQKREAIRAAVLGTADNADTLTLQNELKALMRQRESFLKSTVQPTEELNSLYIAHEEKKTQLSAYGTEINAVGDGRVSFYFDGYEQVFNKDKLDTVNAALVNTTVSAAADSLGGAGDNLLYRLVNPRLWYAVFVSDAEGEASLAEGTSYTVTFDGYEGQTFLANAMSKVHSESGILNTLEFNEDMGPLINSRVIKLTAKSSVSGISVPLDALYEKDGASIITVVSAEGEYDVAVDILAMDEENAIIAPREGEGTLSEGMRYKRK